MKFLPDLSAVQIDVSELALFAYQREADASLMKKYGVVRSTGKAGPDESCGSSAGVVKDVPLQKNVPCGGVSVTVTGTAERVSYDGRIHTLDCLRKVNYFPAGLSPFMHPEHFAEAVLLAHLFAENEGLPAVRIRIVYERRMDGESVSFTAEIDEAMMKRSFDTLLGRAKPFIDLGLEQERLLPQELKEMPFPYRSIRDGQEDFIRRAYRAIQQNTQLLVSAPTGIGKTMSAVFPALKALGEGLTHKIFYLTAKTVTGKAAFEAAGLIARHAPHLRICAISAKEQICARRRRTDPSSPPTDCDLCPVMGMTSSEDGRTWIPYRERSDGALIELLRSEDGLYAAERIRTTAEKYRVCPYSLSVDLSEYCQIVVCDYNYVFDDAVKLKRYFGPQSRPEDYVLLIDEAHNLPDRVRDTYSSSLSTDLTGTLRGFSENRFAGDRDYLRLLNDFEAAWGHVSELCRENESLKTDADGNEVRCGFYESCGVPEVFGRSVSELTRFLGRYVRGRSDGNEAVRSAYETLSQTSFCCRFFDAHFRFFASRIGERVTAQILCLDPSGLIGAALRSVRSAVLFSATLSPMEYFSEMVGLKDADVLELESPYERGNLCLVSYDSVSTRLTDRQNTLRDCAEVIAATVSARQGHYIAYFPSYAYMEKVCRLFARLVPDCDIVMQRKGMSLRERDRFIRLFREHSGKTLVGFCVLGGVFSEGIDLAGNSLIGTVIVGIGMPQISSERNIMAAYFEEKTGRGQDYAYICPGVNKVLQAAGRVIRSEEDRGVIVLVDDRLGDPGIRRLFPVHWRHMRFTGDLNSLSAVLDQFWGKQEQRV